MKTVWVSRPPARAACLIAALEKHHLRGWHYPAFIIADLEKNDALIKFAEAVENYHAIIFITAEAVLRCHHYLPPQKSSAAQFFPIGGGTRRQMELCGYAVANLADYDNLPRDATGDSATLLTLPALQSAAIADKKIAVIGGSDPHNGPSPPLCAALRARGADVSAIAVYHRRASPPLPTNHDLLLLADSGALCAAVAYSSDTAQQMLAITAPDNDWLRHLPLFVIHPNIAAAAKKMGYLHPQLAPPAAADMAAAIARKISY